MFIIPAIDLMNGQCVRLSQGNFNTQKVYSSNPMQTAIDFEKLGFEYLHMVDLDGARQKTPVHFETLAEVAKATNLKVDYSGGIRTLEQAQDVFAHGAFAITIGSLAINNPEITITILQEFGHEKVILGADVKDERIATSGWLEQSNTDVFDFLDFWINRGFLKIMVTDVSKDGMMQGPASGLYMKIIERFNGINLIASGGISSIEDIYALKNMGCWGAITGKALYENTLDLNKLQIYLNKK